VKFLTKYNVVAFYLALVCVPVTFAQTDAQLRDPDFLIQRYNELAAKHNALVEKTRTFVQQKTEAPAPVFDSAKEVELRNELNKALGQVAALETQMLKMKQEGLRNVNSNQYLDETNARLRRQLQQLKADEQDLAQQNKELALENRRLQNAKKSATNEEQSAYAKIRDLELKNSSLQRQNAKLEESKADADARLKNVQAEMDSLLTDNTQLNQRVATIGIDQETSENRLDEFDQLLREAENKISMLENEEILLRESLQSARNEIARLNGNLAIAEDRLSLTEQERGENFGALRRAEIQLDSTREQLEEALAKNTELAFQAQRKDDFARNLEMSNNSLREKMERLTQRNDSFHSTDLAQKEELSMLRTQLNSLSLDESRITNEIQALRDSNEMLMAKSLTLESENTEMLEAIESMRVEIENIEMNERTLIAKLKDLDMENQGLLKDSGSLYEETGFYKEKARQLEVQLNQAVAGERALSQEAAALEAEIANLEDKVRELEIGGSAEYQRLLAETQQLEGEFTEALSREQILVNRVKILENENFNLGDEIRLMQDREREMIEEAVVLKEQNSRLERKVDSSLRIRDQLRDTIIDAIDQNDRFGQSSPTLAPQN
jgi:chromosome segregation ATPase